MDFYLARNDSLRMLRWVRRQEGFCLLAHPGEGDAGLVIERPARADLLRLLDALPKEVADPMREGRAAIRFGGREGKSQSSLARVTPGADALGADAFLEVALLDGAAPWEADGRPVRVFVEGPALSLVSCGLELERRIASGGMSRQAAVLRATAFAMELAGTYGRDPSDPAGGEAKYGLEPVGEVAGMASWLAAPRRLAGIDLARIACSRAVDGAASAMETFWYHAFCMPPRLGGMHFPRPLVNRELEWPDEVRGSTCHGSMRPDFLWPAHRLACEYDGSTHREGQAFRQDRERLRDYALCDVSMLALTSDDSRDLASLRRALGQVGALLARSEPQSFARRVRRNLASPDADAARKVLMSQLLPARPQDAAEEDG